MNSSEEYIPIVLQSIVAAGFVVAVLIVTHLLGPSTRGKNKLENFECGIESEGDARIRFSVKYFMTAILFVLFDVEVIFFYPYAVNFKSLGSNGFMAVLMFVCLFLLGFYYIVKKGALEWEK